MEKPALKLKILNEVMYLCYRNSILEKIEIALRLYLAPYQKVLVLIQQKNKLKE